MSINSQNPKSKLQRYLLLEQKIHTTQTYFRRDFFEFIEKNSFEKYCNNEYLHPSCFKEHLRLIKLENSLVEDEIKLSKFTSIVYNFEQRHFFNRIKHYQAYNKWKLDKYNIDDLKNEIKEIEDKIHHMLYIRPTNCYCGDVLADGSTTFDILKRENKILHDILLDKMNLIPK